MECPLGAATSSFSTHARYMTASCMYYVCVVQEQEPPLSIDALLERITRARRAGRGPSQKHPQEQHQQPQSQEQHEGRAETAEAGEGGTSSQADEAGQGQGDPGFNANA
jgi:hypothetical protein